MGETTNSDELFKVSGDSQAVNVEGNLKPSQNSAEIHNLDPVEDDIAVEGHPDTDQSMAVIEQQPDTEKTPLQQRIAKVKRRSADISQQLETLNIAQRGPTDSGSE